MLVLTALDSGVANPVSLYLEANRIRSYRQARAKNFGSMVFVEGETEGIRVLETPEEIAKLLSNSRSRLGGVKMFDDLKKYLTEHRDFIFTLVLLFLADQFLLGGALRAKLEGILHKQADRLVEATNASKSTS